MQFWGPAGPACPGRTRYLHDVATPSLLPELIPVWPLAVKATASRGEHAKHIGKSERMAVGTVNPTWSIGFVPPLTHREEIDTPVGTQPRVAPTTHTQWIERNRVGTPGHPSSFPHHLPLCALMTFIPFLVSSILASASTLLLNARGSELA